MYRCLGKFIIVILILHYLLCVSEWSTWFTGQKYPLEQRTPICPTCKYTMRGKMCPAVFGQWHKSTHKTTTSPLLALKLRKHILVAKKRVDKPDAWMQATMTPGTNATWCGSSLTSSCWMVDPGAHELGSILILDLMARVLYGIADRIVRTHCLFYNLLFYNWFRGLLPHKMPIWVNCQLMRKSSKWQDVYIKCD